jgi:acyl-CoA thioester hydrolase
MSKLAFRDRTAYRHWDRIGTRWLDNDAYGHVNNAIYYQWFDTVVNRWLIAAGLLDIAQGDPIGLVVETGCRYASPLAFPDAIEVGLAVASIGRSSVTYHLGIFREGADAAAAEGHFTHVYVGRADRRPAPIPDSWRTSLARLTDDRSRSGE